MILYIPNGTKNLRTLFPGIDWNNVAEYSVELVSGGISLSRSNINVIDQCKEDTERIHFINYNGVQDSITFLRYSVEHQNKSETYEVISEIRSEHNINRTNVRSNDNFVCVTYIPEENIDYMDELYDSPTAWVEWSGTQGQPDDYLPVVIVDKKSQKFKRDDRYEYEITIEFAYSKEKLSVR